MPCSVLVLQLEAFHRAVELFIRMGSWRARGGGLKSAGAWRGGVLLVPQPTPSSRRGSSPPWLGLSAQLPCLKGLILFFWALGAPYGPWKRLQLAPFHLVCQPRSGTWGASFVVPSLGHHIGHGWTCWAQSQTHPYILVLQLAGDWHQWTPPGFKH